MLSSILLENILDMDFKSIAIGALSAALVFTIMGAANPQEQTAATPAYATPESHVWEFHLSDPSAGGDGVNERGMAFAINKVTGEVRKYETKYSGFSKVNRLGAYNVCSPAD